MTKTLIVDALIEEAQKATGLEKFDSETFREGLGILCADVNAGDRPEPCVDRMRSDLVAALASRLKTTDYLAKRPELLSRPIEKPVFVFGIPRTGTTMISNLLATAPGRGRSIWNKASEPLIRPAASLAPTSYCVVLVGAKISPALMTGSPPAVSGATAPGSKPCMRLA